MRSLGYECGERAKAEPRDTRMLEVREEPAGGRSTAPGGRREPSGWCAGPREEGASGRHAHVTHPAASYFDALVQLRQARGLGEAFLSWNDLQATVSRVNTQVQEETDRE